MVSVDQTTQVITYQGLIQGFFVEGGTLVYCNSSVSELYRGVARILDKGVLEYARKILSNAHLLIGKVKVQIITEKTRSERS